MRKKFTMLLASLFLTLGTAWALPTEGQLYRIKNVVTDYYLDITSTEVGGIKNKTLDLLDVNQCFYFIPSETDGKHYIKSANNQYVARSGQSLWDMRATDVVPSGTNNNGHITLVSVAGTEDQYYLQTTSTASWGNNMAPNDGDNKEGASIYSDKSQSANYPKWQVIAVTEAELTNLIANAKDVTLAAAITEANAWLAKDKVATSDAGTALSSAVSAAQNLSATAKIEEITAAITAVQTATSAAEKYYSTIADLADLADNEYYKLYGQRGFTYAADGVLKGTNAVNVAYDANNMNQHFAIIKKNDKYYLYNVGAKKFVVKSGNNTTLVDLPEQPITLESTDNADYEWSIKLNGTNKINLSTGWNNYGIYTDYNGTDEGNRWAIYRVGTFDNSEALAAFDKVYVTVNYVLGSKKTVTQKNAIAKGETFSFSNPYVYTTVTSCTKGDETLTANNGTYSFEVTEATTVTVNLEENLPFTLSEGYDNAIWYRLRIRPNNGNGNTPKWVVRKAEKPYDNTTATPTDNNGLWAFVGNAIDGVQVLNKEAGANQTLGFDNMNNNSPAYMKEGATTWTLGKLAKDGYEGFLLRQGTTGNNYLHDYSSKLAFWNNSGAPTDLGSAFIAEAPLSITYLYKGEELTEYKVDTYVNYGTVHTITNPFASAKKYISIGECATTGSQPVNAGGTWSVKVTEATSITVTLVDDLPFKVSESYANATWYYMNIRSNNKKYVAMSDATEYSNVAKPAADDKSLWAFMGDVNGIKIINKAAGEGKTLSFEGDAAGDKAVVMREEQKTWTIERAATGFLLRAGNTGNLYVHDLNSRLKIWNSTSAPTDEGSAFNVVEDKGVKSLEELALNPRNIDIYTIEAERSPLLYDAKAERPTKLSSGMVHGIAANETDINQQFLILRTPSTPEGYFYLYSLGAEKFVDESLNFIDFPSPVLSLVASEHPAYPWRVKIDDKFVIPGTGGTDANKIHHTSEGEDDGGKRYRIVKVGQSYNHFVLLDKLEEAEDMIKATSELSNEKVYTVSTVDGGNWYHLAGQEALWSTGKAEVEANSQDVNQQFAFLTVSEHTYLYSISAEKFVIKKDGNTEYSDVPSQAIELLDAEGSRFYPFVAAFVNGDERHHIGISNGYDIPVITSYNDLNDNGNKIKIREVTPGYMPENAAELLAEAVTKIDNYLAAQELKPELAAKIAEVQALLDKNYLDTEDTDVLTTAKATAQTVHDKDGATSAELTEQINLLDEAIAAVTYVTEITEFKNCYLYTFVSKRGWMVATDANTVKSADEGAADNALHQWAVYKSAKNNYYLYNIGKQQFMGFANVQNEEIPFAATPQVTTLTFKKSSWEDYPIMFSVDNKGVVNNNDRDAMIYWNNGWNNLQDDGNNHKVTLVGAVPSAALTAIENAVVLFEATHALDVAIAEVQAKVDVMDKLGYYSSSNENIEADFNAIKEFKAAITAETAVDVINAQTTAANNLVATFTVLNVPQTGKFYRLKGKASGKYMSTPFSTDATNRVKMRLSENPNTAGCIFYLTAENKLQSYKLGRFLCNTHDISATSEDAGNTVYFNKSESDNLGFFTLKTDYSGSKYIYDDVNDTEVDRNGTYAANNCEWAVEEVVPTMETSIGNLGYSTLYSEVALSIPNGVTAYTGSLNGEWLTLTPIEGDAIPAETAVILGGAAGNYSFFEVTTETTIDNNILQGTATEIATTDVTGGVVYTLQPNEDNNGVVFMEYEGATLAAGKAYLVLSEGQKSIGIRFEGTTDIEHSVIRNQHSEMIFDLLGRRVEAITKGGIYIVNGKKVVVK